MGRNSRAKKQKRDATGQGKGNRAAARGRVESSGVKVITVSFGDAGTEGEDDGHHEDDGCPVCVAMREMGVEDGQTLSDRQMDRLLEAFREAEKTGAPTFIAPRGEN